MSSVKSKGETSSGASEVSSSVDGDTKEKLIRAARSLFAKKGFDGTTVKDLAEQAGVNVSLVSYHFGGKEGLYRSCLESFGKERLAVAERVLQPVQSSEEFRIRLRMFVEEFLSCHIENPDSCQIIQRECDMEVPVAGDVFRDTFLNVFQTLVEYFRGAMKKGFMRDSRDPQLTASIFFGSMMHFGRSDGTSQKYFGLSLKDPAYRKRVVDQLLSCWLEGIAKNGNP